MVDNIIKLFVKKGFLLDREMLDFLSELKDEDVANEIINKIAIVSQKKLITKNLVDKNFEKIKPILFELDSEKKRLIEKYFVNVSIHVEVKKETSFDSEKEIKKETRIKVLSSPVLVSQKLEVKEFVRHFRNRYSFLKNVLQRNPKLENLTSIDKITGNRSLSIIGIVTEKSVTKNKNIILEVEDLTDRTKVLVNQNKEEVYKKARDVLLDDVIGIKCSGTRDFLFVNDLYYPDCFIKEKKKTDEEVYVLFLSDIHLGSDHFLEKNFNRFIDWLNGENCDEKQKDILKKIKYMFVSGDSIDGVGIYPGQEKDLVIKDIKEQYEKLAEFYKKIPKHICVIQCAGQHDGVRVAEPQPPIGEDFAESLHKLENFYPVSNPSLIEIEGTEKKEGIKVLVYHGASMHGIINEIEELRLGNAHSTPAKVVKHLLLRRHLAPSHGAAIYIPNAKEDSLLIKEVPDIITTGDLHRPDIDAYNGVLIISNSCWQSITPFEEKVGNIPDPCKAILLNLKTRELKILDFSDDPEEQECEEVVEEEKEIELGSGREVDKKNIVCEVKDGKEK